MVSAVTGKPAGKEVQLGRHNHLKANLNIKGLKERSYYVITSSQSRYVLTCLIFSVTKNDSNTNANNRSYTYKPLQ